MMRWHEARSGFGVRASEPLASCLSLSSSPFQKKAATTGRRSVYTKYRMMEDIAALAHNKVLLGATVSAAIGQLSKPLTRLLLYGEDFDPKAGLLPGGFPSSHSSAVAATATALALDSVCLIRGLSDSIFGLSVVYAGLIMYDAQGVRREVGNHAKTINRALRRERVNIDDPSGSIPVTSKLTALLSVEELEKQLLVVAAEEEEEDSAPPPPPPLKESVGHTEIEVIAGAVLGVSVTLALHIIFPYL